MDVANPVSGLLNWQYLKNEYMKLTDYILAQIHRNWKAIENL